MSNTDILLICLAIILLLTIIFIIIFGITYLNFQKQYYLYQLKKISESNSSKKETYVKIKFLRSKKILTYIAPKNVKLLKNDKIKVKINNKIIKSAIVVKGNYSRNKYKNGNYTELIVVKK